MALAGSSAARRGGWLNFAADYGHSLTRRRREHEIVSFFQDPFIAIDSNDVLFRFMNVQKKLRWSRVSA